MRTNTPFKIIQGHHCRYKSKDRMRLHISYDILSRTVLSYRRLLFKFWTLFVSEPPFGA